MIAPFKWDEFSDQPAQLKDKNYKTKMRKKEAISLVKTFFISLFILPFSLIMIPFIKRKEVRSNSFFSMGVDFQREPALTHELLEELEVETIMLRFKLWEMDTLGELKDFILTSKAKRDKQIILKVLQDREHIEDLELLKKDMRELFNILGDYVDIFEIGSTINRAKWGFFSVDEYNSFYECVYELKNSKFSHLKLMGSGVIDFEYHFTAHTLFNLYNYRYDATSSLLYVDRRGAPENAQMGFNLSDKIALLSTMVWLSPKTKHSIHITETNWPITGTAPYAPTSEYECVDEESYTDFMLRYYFLAFASQQVDSVSWHQLIAPGYGLVDNRDGIKIRSAFYAYKYMLQNLKNAKFLRMDIKRGYYILQCLVDNKLLQIHWSLTDTTLKNEDFFEAFSKDGKVLKDETLKIGSAPLYIYIKDAA